MVPSIEETSFLPPSMVYIDRVRLKKPPNKNTSSKNTFHNFTLFAFIKLDLRSPPFSHSKLNYTPYPALLLYFFHTSMPTALLSPCLYHLVYS